MNDKYGVDQVLYSDGDSEEKQRVKLAADESAHLTTEAASKVGTRVLAKVTTRRRKGLFGGWRTRRAENKKVKAYEKKIEPYKPAAKLYIADKIEEKLSDEPKAKQTTHSDSYPFSQFSAGTELEELLF